MQIGPRIRVGGSVGKFGEKLKHGAGNLLASSQSISIGGHKFATSPLAFLTSPIAAKLQGKSDSDALRSEEDVGRSALRSAGAAAALMGGQAALGAGGIPGIPGIGGGGSAVGPVSGSANAIADAAQSVPASVLNTATRSAPSFFGNMSLADKLALGSTLLNGVSGVAGGIAQGKQQDFENQQSKDRLAAMQRFRGTLQPPTPFNPTSAFAGQGPFRGQNGPQGAPSVMQNNPLAQGGQGGGDNPWLAVLRARGLA